MFDIDLNCVRLSEHKQLEQQVAYYNGNTANNVNNGETQYVSRNSKQRDFLLYLYSDTY